MNLEKMFPCLAVVAALCVATAEAAPVNVALNRPIIDYSGELSSGFSVDHVTNGGTIDWAADYWLGRSGVVNEYFTLDLEQLREVNTIALWNTHNNWSNDRGTRTFRVWASDQVDGSNQLVNPELILERTLTTSLGSSSDTLLPTDYFNSANGLKPGTYQYLKFDTLSSSFGHNHVGLNEIEVFEEQLSANVAALKPIIKATEYSSSFGASHVTDLLIDEYEAADNGPITFWLGRSSLTDEYFIIDLEGRFLIDRFELQNTHNRWPDDRGTEDFDIWASTEVDGSNDLLNPQLILSDTLTDQTGNGYDMPFDVFSVADADFERFEARYIKFVAKTYRTGHAGTGLNEIHIMGVVPEPSTLWLLLSGGLMTFLLRRRGSRRG